MLLYGHLHGMGSGSQCFKSQIMPRPLAETVCVSLCIQEEVKPSKSVWENLHSLAVLKTTGSAAFQRRLLERSLIPNNFTH